MKVLDKMDRISPRSVRQRRSRNAAGSDQPGAVCLALSTDDTNSRKDAP